MFFRVQLLCVENFFSQAFSVQLLLLRASSWFRVKLVPASSAWWKLESRYAQQHSLSPGEKKTHIRITRGERKKGWSLAWASITHTHTTTHRRWFPLYRFQKSAVFEVWLARVVLKTIVSECERLKHFAQWTRWQDWQDQDGNLREDWGTSQNKNNLYWDFHHGIDSQNTTPKHPNVDFM